MMMMILVHWLGVQEGKSSSIIVSPEKMFPIKNCQNSVSTAKLESYDLCFLRIPDGLAPRDPEGGLV